ncbi:FAD-dependent oxidoreductase [Amycolatopsis acidiphila]|uniref:ferredoxin--NADP(+) reductase n=1 Tax=Amycolatopsis acidiphila TaxID=715473 RepID=A0A558A4L5_9PSEU|nr:FAD-dependent oxidoreductase [Amycolatopsis acidiphila]TVT19197.1 4Fe-4S dicluster domain-containing protein [Amycolatopsis acidiphila]UIJ62016.1 FAD-dependent oxidoreductase [Amycolatopsis acidiphila]GHG56636.1 ferredoxin--NADP(+) reductase [Amycolatopsis acidiphila]
MAFAITQTCCNDASCVAVCPVNCIHPTPDEPDFGSTEMLYVDPRTCIDCGACADACPVDAIFPVDLLTGPLQAYAGINADYYTDRAVDVFDAASPNFHAWGQPVFSRTIPSDFPALDVAVVGTGPAGMYAVEDLLLHTSSRVTLIDRLPVAGGLVRYGVAPDHPSTKKIGEVFARFHHHPRLRLRLGVEVGRDVTVEELAARHDAVIYAVGASSARGLGIPGEDLAGSVPATKVVAWYNGHPDVAAGEIDLSAERVVVVGNGNVALDVARILTADPRTLAGTSISPEALARLESSKVREVVLLGRRGPDAAACTRPELLALIGQEDVELVVDAHDARVTETIDAAGPGEKAALLQGIRRETVDWCAPPRPDGRRRIVFRFHSAPAEVLGDSEVRGLRVTGAAGATEIATGQVVRAVGYRGTPLPGLPFDEDTGTIPNSAGRVADRPGTYVVGWIKRGPSGGIGTNRECARETVTTLLDDVIAGKLPRRARRSRRARAGLRLS